MGIPLRNLEEWEAGRRNRNQMTELFVRDVKTIGKHINNALKEEFRSADAAKLLFKNNFAFIKDDLLVCRLLWRSLHS